MTQPQQNPSFSTDMQFCLLPKPSFPTYNSIISPESSRCSRRFQSHPSFGVFPVRALLFGKMASMGVDLAEAYVVRKAYKEKMKRAEKEQQGGEEGSCREKPRRGFICSLMRKEKLHPKRPSSDYGGRQGGGAVTGAR